MAPDPSRTVSRVGLFAASIFRRTGAKTFRALAFLVLGSFTEGVSILLLIPALQFVESSDAGAPPAVEIGQLEWIFGQPVSVGLWAILALFLGLIVALAIFNRYKNIYLTVLLQNVVDKLRIDLFTSISKARWATVSRFRLADLTHALTADIDRIQSATFNLFMLTQTLVLLVVYLAISAIISLPMTAFAVLVGGGVFLVLRPVRRRAARYGAVLTRRRQDQYRTISDFLSGLKVAKSFNAEPTYVAELDGTLRRLRQDHEGFARLSSWGTVVFQVASAAALVAFIFVAIRQYQVPLPQLVILILLYMRIAPRFAAVQGQLQDIITNLPALDAMEAVKRTCDADREEHDDAVSPIRLTRSLTLDTVEFAYDGPVVLHGVSFQVRANQITALVGPSGSGKSTIADIMMGLLEPQSGTVRVDGGPLIGASRRGWRTRVAYVNQDIFLQHATIAENLALVMPSASRDDMREALRQAEALAFVEELPDGLDTIIGDRGTRFSGGQRQRVALARALLRQPDLLILDEATSALDWESQAAIARALRQLRSRMTIVTIAHRPSMIRVADWVVALEDGRVKEAGTFADLILDSGSRLSKIVRSELEPEPELAEVHAQPR